jgi:CheY-like chemotaxis protein
VKEGLVRLRFSVEDTGIGIPQEKIPSIFDQFIQANGSASRRHGGTGLGLTICKQLVRLMGGSIAATSTVDKGSTFFFELELPWKHDHVLIPEDFLNLSKHRALIVDDMAINRRILGEYLTSWGIAHDSVNSALGALRLLAQAAENGQTYSFMLLDHAMPGMDGLELARTLFINAAHSSPRVILMTSKWGMLNSDQCANLGIWAALPKPVVASDLFNAIGDCLVGRQGMGCAPDEETQLELKNDALETGSTRGHVLVVDDHRINRKTATLLLEKLGFRVSTAENGLEALDIVRSENFDMVFMDVQMPMMDGYETSRTIRALGGRYADLPIIALTANAMENDRTRCLEAGMTDYLPKPLPWDRLLTVIREHQRPPRQEVGQSLERLDFHHNDFLNRYDLELDVAREILQEFLADGPDTLDEILRAMKHRDADTSALVHRFKGPCSYVGAQRLQDLCGKILTEVAHNQWNEAETLTRELASAWENFTAAAHAWLEGSEHPDFVKE